MKIKCLIIDDEPLSQDVLKKYISDCPQLELAEIYSNAVDANVYLQSNSAELLFLDINMPKISGLNFFKSLINPPLVIFTTAYPEYAIEGYEVDAVDYLVKPFSFERFLKAINKVVEKNSIAQLKSKNIGNSILLKSEKRVHKVDFDKIVYLQAIGDYVKVVTSEKNLLIHCTIKGLTEQLPTDEFIRIHKSFVISINRLEYIEGNQVRIHNENLPIGLNYKEELLKRLGN
ncbi:MAG: LytR/AlgR family response regulator transcription factor [Bacteroidales bacterium]